MMSILYTLTASTGMKMTKALEVIKLIESDGWMVVRTKGSHRQYKHPNKSGRVTIPFHSGVDLPNSTVQSILKQAGISKKQ